MYAELTYESVCKMIGLTYKSQDIGASLRESVDKFRLGIDVVNVYGRILFHYRPEAGLNNVISPNVLRVLIHNNHIYRLDKDCKNKLQKFINEYKEQEIYSPESELQVSNKYKLRKPAMDNCDVHFIDDLDDCVDKITMTESDLSQTMI